MYGGGQFELGPGRGHIQYLASIFHPDTPNDVAPGGYNDPDVPAGLPESPLRTAGARDGLSLGLRVSPPPVTAPRGRLKPLYQLRTFPWALAGRPLAMLRPVR